MTAARMYSGDEVVVTAVTGGTYALTRDQLVDAIAGLRIDHLKPAGGVVTICAESMADAILAALGGAP